jgi:hypothetical protein
MAFILRHAHRYGESKRCLGRDINKLKARLKTAGFFLHTKNKIRGHMTSESERGIIKFVLPLVVFAMPGFLIVLKLWLERKKQPGKSEWSDLPRQASIFFLLSYLFWWFLLVLNWFRPGLDWATGFAVLWPVIGILLSLLGCGLAFLARDGEKGKLLLANILFLALSLSSIIAPN